MDSMRSTFFNDGFTVVTPLAGLAAMLREVSSCLVQLVNASYEMHAEERHVSDLTALREMLATDLAQNDTVAHAVVSHVLQTAHESIVQIRENIVPALAQVAQHLGIDAGSQQTIARFRVATQSHPDYDHLWHQDSIDPPAASKGQRTAHLSFWIPLHDVGAEEGALEVSLGSHFHPIPHTETDACGRLFVPQERVRAYQKRVVPLSFGNILALDSWVAHRTVSNTSRRMRIALLVWFSYGPTGGSM